MLAACFWPFDFNPRNEVAWLKGKNGLVFSGRGQAISRDLFPAIRQPSGGGSLTIEAAVRPLEIDGRYSSFILTFLPDTGPPALVLGVWENALRVYVARPGAEQGAKKNPWTYLGDALVQEKTLFVTVVVRERGTALYLDGVLRGDYPDTRFPAGAFPPGRLLLGNSPTGRNSWKGEILAVAVYERDLSASEVAGNHTAWANGTHADLSGQEALVARYDFAEGSGAAAGSTGGVSNDVLIPSVFKPLRRIALQPPPEAKFKQVFTLDAVLNVLGFVPFGLLAMSAIGPASRISARRQSVIVVCSGFALSLAIELTQVFIPARSSSLIDLCANTIGTALGVLLFFVVQQRLNG